LNHFKLGFAFEQWTQNLSPLLLLFYARQLFGRTGPSPSMGFEPTRSMEKKAAHKKGEN
jgi:hypothetical protein